MMIMKLVMVMMNMMMMTKPAEEVRCSKLLLLAQKKLEQNEDLQPSCLVYRLKIPSSIKEAHKNMTNMMMLPQAKSPCMSVERIC